jgi:anti-anti-sigma factor
MSPRSVVVQAFTVEVVRLDGTAVVMLRGELDIATVGILSKALAPIVARYRPNDIVIDCTDLAFIDASGIGVLIRHLGTDEEAEGTPTLRGANRVVSTILRITGTTHLFNLEHLSATVRDGEPHDIEE